MRIKKLELVGFKSFKDRTVIQYDHGITGVVGPNGCGKSNIVDALVWVMGEMSAKHLRGSSMEDVIFAGAEGYAPMGMAEVSLTLENDGGPFPAKYARFSEIMVTRRLHRSGESEYLINKEPARLRDIQEIFMDTGAGSKGFSIIEQGAIGKIITAKPIDRRVLIEEAAGITKFKVRKRESQRKLEGTDQNLVRLQDILAEQKRQLDSLERQAQRAERYRKLKTELQDKDLWLSSKQYLELHHSTADAEGLYNTSREREVELSSRMSAMELEVQELKLRATELESLLTEKQTAHQTLTSELQNAEFRIKELNMAIDQAKRSEQRTGSMLSQYEMRKTNLENEKAQVEEKLTELREDAHLLESEYQSKNSEYESVQTRIQQLDTELSDRRREMLSVSTALSHADAREQGLRAKVEERQAALIGHQTALDELTAGKAEFESRRNRVYKELEGERQMQFQIARDVETIQSNLNSLKEQETARRQDLEGLKDELNQVASRLYGLENMQSNFEGFEEGVKSVMMWQKTRQSEGEGEGEAAQAEIFRPLAEVVEVPAQYEMALEASVGTRLQMLLSPSNDKALGAVDYLKESRGGRSSFVSADGLQAVETTSADIEHAIRQEQGVHSLLHDVVQVPETMRAQVAHFFKDIVVVDSIRTALMLRPRYPGRSFVTMDGDMLAADGVLTGGASEGADSGVLRRRREIKELSTRREELSGKVQLAQLSLRKIEERKLAVEEELEVTRKNVVEKEILIAQLAKDLERAELEFKNAEAARDRKATELQREEESLNALTEQLSALESELLNLRERRQELEQTVEQMTAEFESSRAGIGDMGRKVSDLRVNAASKKQELEGLERQSLFLEQNLNDLNAQLNEMAAEVERSQTELTEGQIAVEELQTEVTRKIHMVQESELALAAMKNQYEEHDALLTAKDTTLSESRGELNQVKNNLNEAHLKMEQLRMKEENLISQMQERYMVNLAEVATQFKDVPGDMIVIQKEVEELRDKVRKIGEVNLSAIQEYDELVERYSFLNQQYQDLLEAKDHLKKVIDRINRICSRRFKETFEQVNERFRQVFPVLFGGGEASLILVEDPDGDDDPGIDIVAKPPGKKLQNVSLLSGGEKALTAVSLIFSIFLVKPSPFCLLDEVDAPLDDANVMRFNELVKEMAKRSQIIVVTHNKHTMKVNNKLYGVTMQEKGVSKMVSVSLEDAEKFAEA